MPLIAREQLVYGDGDSSGTGRSEVEVSTSLLLFLIRLQVKEAVYKITDAALFWLRGSMSGN